MTKFLIVLYFSPLISFAQTSLDKAKSLYESKNFIEAEKILKSIPERSTDYAASRFYLGRVAFDKKDYDAASDYFEDATKANSKESEYYQWLGDTYGSIAQNANVFKQGLLAPKMKNAWEQAIALDAKNINARNSLIQFYLQAPGFMGGSIDKAREIAKQVIAIKPAEGHRQMGNVLDYEKKNTEAEKEYLEMVKADPKYEPVLANFYIKQKRYSEAFNLFEETLKKNPDDFVSIYQIGKTAAISGQKLERGEDCLRKYLAHEPKPNEPSHGGANMRLGQIKEKKGNKSEAKKYFETALKLDASLKEAKEGLERCSK